MIARPAGVASRRRFAVGGRADGATDWMSVSTTGVATGVGLIVLGIAGEQYGFSTLAPAVALTLADLAIEVVHRQPRVVRLIDIWRLAFAYLFGSEVVSALWEVRADFGIGITSAAEGLIVAGFGASLLGYAIGRMLGRRCSAPRRLVIRSRPRVLKACLMALSTLILAYLALAVAPQNLLTPRAMRNTDRLLGPAAFAIVPAIIIQGVLTAQLAAMTRRRGALAYPILVAVLTFVALYANATRYFLGFFAGGGLFFLARFTQPMARRHIAILACALLSIAVVQGTMRVVRGAGLGAADAGSVLASLTQRETYFKGEGMLRVHAWVHRKEVFKEEGRALEHAFLLYWWIPRTLWPAKPTMDGHWLAHEVMADVDASAGHSVAGGVTLPALLDFGRLGSIAFCLLYGLAIWRLDRFVEAHADPLDPASVVSALLPFAVFFGMRSPQLSAIFVECCLGVYLPLFVVLRLSARRLRAAVPTTGVARPHLPVPASVVAAALPAAAASALPPSRWPQSVRGLG